MERPAGAAGAGSPLGRARFGGWRRLSCYGQPGRFGLLRTGTGWNGSVAEATTSYVCRTSEGGWRIVGSRVSLDSVVYAHREGRSPEAIADAFPSLSLEQIYGAIAFYLRHRAEIDQHLVDLGPVGAAAP